MIKKWLGNDESFQNSRERKISINFSRSKFTSPESSLTQTLSMSASLFSSADSWVTSGDSSVWPADDSEVSSLMCKWSTFSATSPTALVIGSAIDVETDADAASGVLLSEIYCVYARKRDKVHKLKIHLKIFTSYHSTHIDPCIVWDDDTHCLWHWIKVSRHIWGKWSLR